MMKQPILFGVRHLSPGAAWHLRRKLDEVKPSLVLVEGPHDLTDQMPHICAKNTRPPLAIMAYTKESPIRTILYPFSVYSPEYQAILWAHEHHVPCRFMDLPAGVFLSLQKARERDEDADDGTETPENTRQSSPEGMTTEHVYRRLYELGGDEDHDTFWERRFEHLTAPGSYQTAAVAFGKELRRATEASEAPFAYAENLVREAYMRRQIQDAVDSGVEADRIVCVCGAYHVEGLEHIGEDGAHLPMTDEEVAALPRLECHTTLMPYSYYRLSTRAGYGAGNKAPAYYELLWQAMEKGHVEETAFAYLTRIAAYQRGYGHMTSSAEVIEAVRLAQTLAAMKGFAIPSLGDLHDAASTCMGHGHFSEIALAAADTEIGTTIGSLPEGISRTSIQEDFYRLLKELRLDGYRKVVAEALSLDLREKLQVKSEKAAFMDLNRSLFLHRLRVLGIHFAQLQNTAQDKATWAENWVLQWTPEAEIEIVEAALLGDTVMGAASFALKERAEASQTIAQAVAIMTDAFLCGMPETVTYAVEVLQRLAVDAAAVQDIAKTAVELSVVIRYGSLRRLDSAPLVPLLSQLFLRACLTLEAACICDNMAAKTMIEAMDQLNTVQLNHAFLEEERWIQLLTRISDRDDLNTRCSGFATAILLERSRIDGELLSREVSRRLSKGIPADLGAGWFEGLSQKNRYALITRLHLWEQLSQYLDSLDEEEFKRALVFLRRAFADFTPREKNDIAENLGVIWGVDSEQVADVLMRETTEEEQELIGQLDDFDFGDI